MPDSYVDLPITFDQESLQDDAVAYLQDKVPGLALDPAHPETWIIEAVGRMAAEAAFVASQVPAATVRALGESLYGISRGDGSPAVASTIWTAVDTDGHTIPAGTVVVIDDVAFATDSEATIPSGSTSVSDVAVTALENGTQANGLGTSADSVDAFVWLASVTVFGTTSGGTDPETDEEYQDRLASMLSLQAPRPITPRDFQVFTAQYDGVARVAVLDGYNTADSTYNNERMVTVVPIDADGASISTTNAALAATIKADLEAKREVNFVVNVGGATYTTVTVAYTAKAYADFDLTALEAEIDAAIEEYLSPATWGLLPYGNDPTSWDNTTVVRLNKIVQVIENVAGVKYADTVTINGSAADLTLTGAAPLPSSASSASGTVTL